MKIIGHRGASAVFPENTLAAFARAWDVGADGIELDVRLSSDGEVVVFHDEDGRRLAGVPDAVSRQSFSSLSTWRINGETIPRLDDVLTASPPNSLTLVEIKCGAEILPALQTVMARHPRQPVGFLTFDADLAIKAVHHFQPHPVLLNLEPTEVTRLESWATFAVKHRLAGLSLGWSEMIDDAAVRLVHRHGLLVAVWTVNDPVALRQLLASGVDFLMTDDPGRMIVQVHRG